MKDLKIKRLELLNETIAHYTSKNRSVLTKTFENIDGVVLPSGRCLYFPPNENSEGCAIGRKIEDKELCKKLDTGNYGSVSQTKTFNELPESLRVLGQSFLGAVQSLHDGEGFWNEGGLSYKGEEMATIIKKQFDLLEVEA